MAHEIERKFLVDGGAWKQAASAGVSIEQCYLAVSDNASVRVRIVDGNTARIGVKSRNAGMTRMEFEYVVPVADARAMQALCIGKRIEKRRHEIRWHGKNWEVDVFAGDLAGLIVAECELEAEGEALHLPEWVGAEVTVDSRYYNEALALCGLPEDQAKR